MKKSKFLMVATLLTVLLLGMSACSKSSSDVSTNENQSKVDDSSQPDKLTTGTAEKSDDNSNNDSNSSKSDNSTSSENQSKPDNTSTSENSSQANDVSRDNSEEKPTIVISSGEEAVEYLKQQLPEGKDDDVSFGVDETLATDDKGSYYTIQLVSISIRVSGKTGTLGYYKVYQDGTYQPY